MLDKERLINYKAKGGNITLDFEENLAYFSSGENVKIWGDESLYLQDVLHHLNKNLPPSFLDYLHYYDYCCEFGEEQTFLDQMKKLPGRMIKATILRAMEDQEKVGNLGDDVIFDEGGAYQIDEISDDERRLLKKFNLEMGVKKLTEILPYRAPVYISELISMCAGNCKDKPPYVRKEHEIQDFFEWVKKSEEMMGLYVIVANRAGDFYVHEDKSPLKLPYIVVSRVAHEVGGIDFMEESEMMMNLNTITLRALAIKKLTVWQNIEKYRLEKIFEKANLIFKEPALYLFMERYIENFKSQNSKALQGLNHLLSDSPHQLPEGK